MNPYLLPTIEFGPVVIERLFQQISEERWDEALEEGRFTPRQVLAHLADWEPIMRGRIETGRTTPGATIEAYDEMEMAQAHGYAFSDPLEQIELYRERRRETAERLRTLGPDDRPKTVNHPERGVMTLDDLANLLLGHDLYHIEQLSAYLP